jgi:outer membrane protein TolC
VYRARGGAECHICSALLVLICVLAGGRSEAKQPTSAPPQPTRLSLSAAVAEALDHAPAIMNARSNIEQANLSVRLAGSAFDFKVLPSVLGSFGQSSLSNQTYGVNVSQKFVGGTQITGDVIATSFRNQLGTYYNSDTTFQVTQPLLRGFGSSVTRRPLFDAESRATDANRQLALTEQQVALDVASAYYAIVVQTRLVQVAKAALDRAGNLRDASLARLATGRVSQLDALRAEQLTGQAEAQRLDAEGALADAHDRLAILIGRRATEDFSVDEEIPVGVEPLDAEQAVKLAMERRPELRTAMSSIGESERRILAARSQLHPQVDVSLALSRQRTVNQVSSAFGLNDFHVATLASINAPVDRTAEAVELQNALIERGQRQRDLEAQRDRAALEARQSSRRQERALRSLALARSSVELAEKEMEVATSRFQLGLSNNLDLVSAQGTLRGAEGQEIVARAEVALARLAVRAATGVLDPRLDIK